MVGIHQVFDFAGHPWIETRDHVKSYNLNRELDYNLRTVYTMVHFFPFWHVYHTKYIIVHGLQLSYRCFCNKP